MKTLYATLVFAVSVLTVTACSRSHSNQTHDTIQAMSESSRQALLASIVPAPHSCTPNRSFFMGMTKGNEAAAWSVGCTTGQGFMILLKPNWYSRVIDCDQLKTLTGVDCFAGFQTQAVAEWFR